ncbi:MAG: UDP-3-O-acyl-N-acetylglucosamine deacetylase, partial [Phycisphaerales bacterium]|nr:UDP-3-O-acyl-N-acetylglucosamine deacetylase [Phycisphaerales bacterium]
MNDQLENPPATEGIMDPQQTLRAEVEVSGRGLMHGQEATLRMLPASPDHGIVFERVDLDPPVRIPAQIEYAIDRDRRTAIRNGDAVVETIEHCMSALRGCGIDNVLLQLDGPEVPLGDGSAISFIEAIRGVDVEAQPSPRHLLHISEP